MAARQDPLLGFQFGLEIEGGPVKTNGAYFRELSGFGVEYQVAEHKIVDKAGMPTVQKMPSLISYSPVTLKRGITADLSLWTWHRAASSGELSKLRASVTITMYNRNYTPVIKWNLVNAWPSKISGPQFQADGADIAMEEITLVYESMTEKLEAGGG